ncbi:PTS sugar transporter subunit IIB [Mollicutes bacterium LVI A0039]|nr:PTS sugar transporter subunit IIB [Mollicutes bacterium LVI A0039]
MKVVQLRFDSRLIHGQVVSFWTNDLSLSRIMVVGDHIVESKLQKEMLKVSCPSSCKLSILRVQTAIKNLLERKYEGDRILVIVDDFTVMNQLLTAPGINEIIKNINIGNVSTGNDKIMVTKSIYLNKSDYEVLCGVDKMGYNLFAQMVPNNSRVNIMNELMEKAKENKWN